MGVSMTGRKLFYHSILFLVLMGNSSAFAKHHLPYCIQNQEGLSCFYENFAECELFREDKDMCIANPRDDKDMYASEEDPDTEYSAFMQRQAHLYGLCTEEREACIVHEQELCSEDGNTTDEKPLSCSWRY